MISVGSKTLSHPPWRKTKATPAAYPILPFSLKRTHTHQSRKELGHTDIPAHFDLKPKPQRSTTSIRIPPQISTFRREPRCASTSSPALPAPAHHTLLHHTMPSATAPSPAHVAQLCPSPQAVSLNPSTFPPHAVKLIT